jgi:hypothetical protein
MLLARFMGHEELEATLLSGFDDGSSQDMRGDLIDGSGRR